MHRRGHVYWAQLEKRRPALVVSVDARNERANDVLVIPCSTTMREAPTHVRLRRGEGGLPQDFVLKCEQITTLKNYQVDAVPLGMPIRPARMREVERAVLRAIGIPIR
ncbi:MAG TPA: type II toxin-antitoxin system PemK/MazF family toxin [Polyangia bacterium]|nr:type II toxin-antitoxin system PemK/MazF family toxin [Polyangia bacterium]